MKPRSKLAQRHGREPDLGAEHLNVLSQFVDWSSTANLIAGTREHTVLARHVEGLTLTGQEQVVFDMIVPRLLALLELDANFKPA